jgi:hypothetical protein
MPADSTVGLQSPKDAFPLCLCDENAARARGVSSRLDTAAREKWSSSGRLRRLALTAIEPSFTRSSTDTANGDLTRYLLVYNPEIRKPPAVSRRGLFVT